jgi:hypothetical protein
VLLLFSFLWLGSMRARQDGMKDDEKVRICQDCLPSSCHSRHSFRAPNLGALLIQPKCLLQYAKHLVPELNGSPNLLRYTHTYILHACVLSCITRRLRFGIPDSNKSNG